MACLVLGGFFSTVQAQSRLSDKDVEHLMSNLHSDVQSFRGPFNSALNKSAIRKTSQESDAKHLAKQLESQTGSMLDTFKHKQKADDAFKTVLDTAQHLDGIVQQLGPQSAAAAPWARVQSAMNALAQSFGVTTPFGQQTAPAYSAPGH
jgi:uncharacterized damage-inducible protein DinB